MPTPTWWTRVRAFPRQEAFLREIEEAGFTDLEVRKLTFGIARIYCGVKPSVYAPGGGEGL